MPHQSWAACESAMFFGAVTLDVEAALPPEVAADREKLDAQISIAPGGLPRNAAWAYQLAASSPVEVTAIVAHDDASQLTTELLRREFPRLHLIQTARAGRVSVIVPISSDAANSSTGTTMTLRHRPAVTGDWGTSAPRDRYGTKTLTQRTTIDRKPTTEQLMPLLKACGGLVIGSLTAGDAGMIEDVLGKFSGRVYFNPTCSQLANRETTLRICRRCAFVQMNADELRQLMGDIALKLAMYLLCAESQTTIIVTDGERGLHAFDGEHWLNVPALDVPVTKTTLRCGDILCGTTVAGLVRGLTLHESLRLASAAAAMWVCGQDRKGGFDELRAFAAATPLHAKTVVIPLKTIGASEVSAIRKNAAWTAPRLASCRQW